jgi:hypothetical protein
VKGICEAEMITFFSTPKPFEGHIGVIQRNAIRSWQRLYPEVEAILFGDDQGTAEVCQELGVVHVKEVEKNRLGTNYVASIFDRAQEIARHDLLCYANCDIVLTEDFRGAVELVRRTREQFLAAGRRWDVDLGHVLDFDLPGWGVEVRRLAKEANRQRPVQFIDYFVFKKGLYYHKIPELVIGRAGWDNWMIWFANSTGVPVVDVSETVCAVHQNHDYSHHPEGEKGIYEGEEAQENYRLLEGHRKFGTLANATYLLEASGLRPNHKRWFVDAKRRLRGLWSSAWFCFLDFSRPLRHKLGLRQRVRT